MSKSSENSSLTEHIDQSKKDISFKENTQKYFESSIDSSLEKLNNFSKYVPRQILTNFLTKYELFKLIQNVHGSIVECGVYKGQGLLTWAKLSSILEPYNHQRRIFGFDTFSGIPSISEKDSTSTSQHCHESGLSFDSFLDITQAIDLYDSNRCVGHIPKVELIKGDILETVPNFIEKNPHILVSLLYLDAVVYKPTITALEHFVPKMPKGSIIAFDELNSPLWPGESIAVHEFFKVNEIEIQRINFSSAISYAVL